MSPYGSQIHSQNTKSHENKLEMYLFLNIEYFEVNLYSFQLI